MKGRDGALPELVRHAGLVLVLALALASAGARPRAAVTAASSFGRIFGPSRGPRRRGSRARARARHQQRACESSGVDVGGVSRGLVGGDSASGTSESRDVTRGKRGRVSTRKPCDRAALLDCWNAPSVACPSASGDDSAVLAAKTRPFTLSMSTNENLASTLSSRSFIFRPMALALGSACAWHARVNASPTSRALSVWLTRTTSASGRSSTCGECAGPASGEGTPSPRKATAPNSSSTIRYWGGALARFALTLALRGMEAGVQKSQEGGFSPRRGKKGANAGDGMCARGVRRASVNRRRVRKLGTLVPRGRVFAPRSGERSRRAGRTSHLPGRRRRGG